MPDKFQLLNDTKYTYTRLLINIIKTNAISNYSLGVWKLIIKQL